MKNIILLMLAMMAVAGCSDSGSADNAANTPLDSDGQQEVPVTIEVPENPDTDPGDPSDPSNPGNGYDGPRKVCLAITGLELKGSSGNIIEYTNEVIQQALESDPDCVPPSDIVKDALPEGMVLVDLLHMSNDLVYLLKGVGLPVDDYVSVTLKINDQGTYGGFDIDFDGDVDISSGSPYSYVQEYDGDYKAVDLGGKLEFAGFNLKDKYGYPQTYSMMIDPYSALEMKDNGAYGLTGKGMWLVNKLDAVDIVGDVLDSACVEDAMKLIYLFKSDSEGPSSGGDPDYITMANDDGDGTYSYGMSSIPKGYYDFEIMCDVDDAIPEFSGYGKYDVEVTDNASGNYDLYDSMN
ncbi:hypothetical protein L4174_009995 [Photobacterium sp. CCB-ST2H9]|uniref:hypothetical protein n=1 Tax=unclassified Photobacterium TaxID=2628852 RepID=UPI002005FF6A|nr:hypothetical protein [Photobacterium sp. CCB-ST2H9]UTM56179.1 hypothetical protein L4174_009995 [Photobacterium sp. CCB-ST2H9]